MSKKANTTAIGAFVVGAIVLTAAAIIIFGGGRFFKETNKFVLFFEGSVQGLNRGASVAFKGVKVGSVTEVKVLLDSRDLSLQIPVFIEIEPDRLTEMRGIELSQIAEETEGKTIMDYLVEKGLRAQLDIQSLVTGQLFVNLDFFPSKPARYVNVDTGLKEIPTVPSSLEIISKTVEKLPIYELASKANRVLRGIERWVNSPEMEDIMVLLAEAVRDVRNTMLRVNQRAEPILAKLEETLGEAHGLLHDVRTNLKPVVGDVRDLTREAKHVVQGLDDRANAVASNLGDVLKVVESAVKKADKTLGGLEGMVGEESGVRHEFYGALKELSAAARSIRLLAEYLERHPEALVHGKGGYGGKVQ